jgi:L-lactate dehydrogenase complex protein LldG
MVLLPQSEITGACEDGWTMLRETAQGMPRAVNWVTGPSRSDYIEQTLLLGAHSPRRLHNVTLNDKNSH